MAKGVRELAVAVAPELIGNRHFDFRAGLDSAIEGRIDIFEINVQTGRGSADGLRRQAAEVGELIAQHDDGVADF